jgi:acyl-CoA thioesterase FadM
MKLSAHYTTASLQVTYLKPAPVDKPVTLRARVKEMEEKRIVVTCSVFSDDRECARGELTAVRVEAAFWAKQ